MILKISYNWKDKYYCILKNTIFPKMSKRIRGRALGPSPLLCLGGIPFHPDPLVNPLRNLILATSLRKSLVSSSSSCPMTKVSATLLHCGQQSRLCQLYVVAELVESKPVLRLHHQCTRFPSMGFPDSRGYPATTTTL